MKDHELVIDNLSDIKAVAKDFISKLKGSKKIAFYGKMGAGKTTFINALLGEFEIGDHPSSPTFSIINEYFSVNYGKIYHFDFYRINDEMEALDLGIEEIFEEDAYCFIEWPEKIENLLPFNIVSIYLKEENNIRTLQFQL